MSLLPINGRGRRTVEIPAHDGNGAQNTPTTTEYAMKVREDIGIVARNMLKNVAVDDKVIAPRRNPLKVAAEVEATNWPQPGVPLRIDVGQRVAFRYRGDAFRETAFGRDVENASPPCVEPVPVEVQRHDATAFDGPAARTAHSASALQIKKVRTTAQVALHSRFPRVKWKWPIPPTIALTSCAMGQPPRRGRFDCRAGTNSGGIRRRAQL